MILTLCGSARFEKEYLEWKELLGLAGHSVFDLCVYPSQKVAGKNWYTPAQKEVLDRVHIDKIRASDGIVLLNVGGYIGASTMGELRFARKHTRLVYVLEKLPICATSTVDTRCDYSARMLLGRRDVEND